jgi:hypothetical protein
LENGFKITVSPPTFYKGVGACLPVERSYAAVLRFNNFKFFLFFICISNILYAQEPQTIRVKREQNLAKVYFDNTELKLIVIDRFGNPRENKIVSYKLWIKENSPKGLNGFDNSLSSDMINELNKQKKAVKIFFTEINVQDDNGHLVKLPDAIETWFPNCKNCVPDKRKK